MDYSMGQVQHFELSQLILLDNYAARINAIIVYLTEFVHFWEHIIIVTFQKPIIILKDVLDAHLVIRTVISNKLVVCRS